MNNRRKSLLYKRAGALIRRARLRAGLSQKKAAEKLGVGSRRMSNWECGVSTPPKVLVAPLASLLQTTPVDLGLTGEILALRSCWKKAAGAQGTLIMKARQKRGLSPAELASLADLDLSTIYKWEKRDRPLPESKRRRLARAIGCRISTITPGPKVEATMPKAAAQRSARGGTLVLPPAPHTSDVRRWINQYEELVQKVLRSLPFRPVLEYVRSFDPQPDVALIDILQQLTDYNRETVRTLAEDLLRRQKNG